VIGRTPGGIVKFMKYVFSSPDPARIALVQSLLDAEGVEIELRNQAVSQAEVGMPFITELWVLRDEDYERARGLIQVGDVNS
jgi:hypothetical protein